VDVESFRYFARSSMVITVEDDITREWTFFRIVEFNSYSQLMSISCRMRPLNSSA